MYDTGKVLAGLVIFLGVVTSPMWYQSVRGAEPDPPELELPTESRQCVAPTRYMRSLHMDLLNVWRDEAVRNGERSYVAFDGKEYEKSFAGTCMSCHSSRESFCDRCHEYVGAEPYCWDCHGRPAGSHFGIADS